MQGVPDPAIDRLEVGRKVCAARGLGVKEGDVDRARAASGVTRGRSRSSWTVSPRVHGGMRRLVRTSVCAALAGLLVACGGSDRSSSTGLDPAEACKVVSAPGYDLNQLGALADQTQPGPVQAALYRQDRAYRAWQESRQGLSIRPSSPDQKLRDYTADLNRRLQETQAKEKEAVAAAGDVGRACRTAGDSN